jgi:ATPase subunit of ABC transporter with duplicated ATPase domains
MAQKEMQILKLLATLSAASWLLAMAAPALAQGDGPVPVVVSIAGERLLAPVTAYPGTVISRNQARLAAEVEGRLEWVAEVGVVVRKGETVARLDDVLLKHSLLADEAAVERERARLKYQSAEVRRLAPLVKKQSVPESQLDEAVANSGMTRAEIASGQARVALARERLARARLRNPQILLLDEPTSNLDSESREKTLQMLQEFRDGGMAIVIVTHDPEIFGSLPNGSLHLDDHRIIYDNSKVVDLDSVRKTHHK